MQSVLVFIEFDQLMSIFILDIEILKSAGFDQIAVV